MTGLLVLGLTAACGGGVGLMAACGGGEPLPEVSRFRHQRLTSGVSAVPWPAILEGRHFRTSAQEPLGFELLRVKPAYPRVRIALRHLNLESETRARAEIPPGVPGGIYRLVVRRGLRWRIAPQRVRVRERRESSAQAAPVDLRIRRPLSQEGGRLVVSGANLINPVLISLHGPHRRQTTIRPEVERLDRRRASRQRDAAATPEEGGPAQADRPRASAGKEHKKAELGFGHKHGPKCGHDHDEDPADRAKRAADAVGDTPEPLFVRMGVTELSNLHSVHGTRLLARLPRSLAPGRYFVQVYTSRFRGNLPKYTVEVTPAGQGRPRLWHLGWLGLLLVGCGLGVVRWARPLKVQGHRALMLLLLAALCLAPLGFLV